MAKKKSLKQNSFEWALILGIPAILYLTGLHTEVIGRIQQGMLYTGLIRPEISLPEDKQVKADYDLSLLSLDGNLIHLSDYKGKVIFLNLWASWCPPCVAEMPNIHELYKKTDNEDVVFFMVSLDDTAEKASEFIKKYGYTFPVYLPAGYIPDVFRSPTIPTTFIISPDGKIVSKREGMAQYDTPAFRSFLKGLAKR